MKNLNEQLSRIKSMMKMVNEGEYTKEGNISELGGYIGDAPEKISGPKIAKIDPRIHEGYSGYDVLKAQKLLLNIYSYGDIDIPTEDYLKLSNYMKEIYESVKYDENWEKNHGESSVENDDYDERQERNYGVNENEGEPPYSTYNEFISDIDDYIKRQKGKSGNNLQSQLDQLIDMAIKDFSWEQVDPRKKFRGYEAIVKVPVKMDENTFATVKFIIEWNEYSTDVPNVDAIGHFDELMIELHDVSDNLKELQDAVDDYKISPSDEVVEPLHKQLEKWASESRK